ncbi:hypothetical protein D9M69_684670 [compost metagenome]
MPALMPTPAKANTPVIGIEPPMTMSSVPCAFAANGTAAARPAAISRARRWGESFFVVLGMCVSWF